MNRKSLLTCALAALVLAACGGGGTDTAGIQGSGVTSPTANTSTVGPISGFGSVFVNSIEYNTSGAQITIDGQPGTEAQLEAGQIVTITGTVNSDGTTGNATQLAFVGDVQGPISQIDATNNDFTVLGQTVVVADGTLLDSSTLPGDSSGLQTGSTVEVSGFMNSTGQIVASRIASKAAGALQVKGSLQALDTVAHTFHINTLVVDYSSVSPVPTLANGNVVVVQGNSVNGAGALVATSVTLFKGLGVAANQRADIQGLITSMTSAADFFVGSQEVTTDSNTQLVLHGVTLAANVAVRVTGTFNSAGILQAQKVEAKQQGASAVAGPVDSVTAADNTLSVLGVKVAVSSMTALDDRGQHLKSFRFSDIHIGDYVEVAGAESPPGTVNAATLVRDKTSAESVVQGVASNVASPNLTVLGVQVVTTAQTRFSVPGGGADKATAFFMQAQLPNVVVTITGKFSGGVLTADTAAILP